MSTRLRAIPVVVVIVFAFIFFGLVNYLAARQNATSEERIAALRAEVQLLRQRELETATGTAGRHPVSTTSMMDDDSRAAIVADVKRELSAEMGLLPLTLLRDRRNSFVELNTYDDKGVNNYGTAGYLGKGYFITVKHAVVALGPGGTIRSATHRVDQDQLQGARDLRAGRRRGRCTKPRLIPATGRS